MFLRFLGILLACLTLCQPARAAEKLVFAHLFPENSPQQQVLLKAKRELAARSGGALILEILPRGQVGDQDTRIIEAISLGRADMTFAGGAFAARDYGPIGLLSAPFNFRDFDHWRHFRGSNLARELAAGYEKASGLAVLGYVYYGVRHISAKTAIRTPQDMVGLKIRAGNAPVFLQLFRSLGAKPTPIPFGEIYNALKDGTVDAQDNPLAVIESFNFYRVTPFIALTGHITDTSLTVISRFRLERLPPDQQRIVREVFANTSNELSEILRSREMEAEDGLTKKGATLVAVDREAFRQAVQPLVTGGIFAWSGELYDRLQAIP